MHEAGAQRAAGSLLGVPVFEFAIRGGSGLGWEVKLGGARGCDPHTAHVGVHRQIISP
jgi:hypothetical protein